MRVIRPSPGVKILRLLLCHVCHVAPGSRESVSSHRYHTHHHSSLFFACLALPCLVCVSVCPIYGCPSGPSIRQPVSRCLAGYRDIFGVRYFCSGLGTGPLPSLCLPYTPPPFSLGGASNSSHVAAARIAADFTPHPAPRLVRGTLFLDATVPFSRADSCLGGFCDRRWPHRCLCAGGCLAWNAPQERHS